jgi:hypothetical protein
VHEVIDQNIKLISTTTMCKKDIGLHVKHYDEKIHGEGICYLWVYFYIFKRLESPSISAENIYQLIDDKYIKIKTFGKDILQFQDKLLLERESIILNEKIPEKTRDFLRQGWLLDKDPNITYEKMELNRFILSANELYQKIKKYNKNIDTINKNKEKILANKFITDRMIKHYEFYIGNQFEPSLLTLASILKSDIDLINDLILLINEIFKLSSIK